MQVTQTIYKGEYDTDRSLQIKLKPDNQELKACVLSFGEGEPEDMSLARDLNDAYSLVNLVKIAYQCGQAGEPIEFITKTEEY